ncbi:tetratricopeptide repeat protein [Brumicola nitratireducens]|uniref:PEP-CTERM system TPR-repeat protein PrsT n=1 Tax=Glaciecola nitratireducens (strain JCM 12485 / KCTC 12276 / FR1064) TaxID=1085623 RepID=G4QM54_GLANF|nr:tetratricopeptide repeat protein [Glaciecola nitratireducens]AEP30625.1 hypothetical protein GNIT_2528 [Glaciecola nitratireducens FR1064]
MRKLSSFILISLFTVSLIGCSEPKEEEQVEQSQKLIAESNYAEAIIVLKDVVVKNKNNDDARSLLADAYFKNGDFIQSEKELIRVTDLRKHTPKEQEQLLLAIYFQQDGFRIIDIELDDKATDLSKVLKAFITFSSTNRFNDVVDPVIPQLITQDSKLLLDGLIAYSLENFTVATEQFSQIKNKEAYFPFVSVINGLAHYQSGENEAALDEYNLILKSSINFDLVKLYKSEALIQFQKYDEAKVILAKLSKKYEKQPVVTKLLSLIDYADEDYVNAKRNSELAITYGISDSTVRGIAALSSMSLQNYEAAYQHFQTMGSDIQRDASFNAAYLYTKLKLGYEADVAETLMQRESGVESFPNITASTIENLLANREFDMAEKLEQQIIEKGMSSNTSIARALVKMGNVTAIEVVENELKVNPSADSLYTLVSYYFNSQDFEQAKTLSLKYLQTEPNSLMALNALMLSHANLEENDEALAIAAKIQTLSKNEAISSNFIAIQQFENNDYDASYKTLSESLSDNILNVSLLKTMRTINIKIGEPERSLPFFQKAYEFDNQAAYKFWYAQALTDAKLSLKVIELLKNHQFTANTPRAIWVFLADAYTYNEQHKNAVNLLESWVRIQPNDAFAYIKLLSQPQAKRLVPGIYNLVKEGLLRFKDNELFSLFAAQYAIDLGDEAIAKRVLTSISPEVQKSLFYKNQYGRYLLLTKKYDKALPLLIAAYENEPNFFHLSQVNNAYLGMLQSDKAIEAINSHLISFPDDALAKMLKADVLMWTDPDAAIEEYMMLLQKYPKNAVAMNNIAWLSLQKGEISQARNFAQQAVDLFPTNSNFLDTLAQTYLREENYKTAQSLLALALKNNPTDINIFFNYADALYGVGQKENAVRVLKNIRTVDPKLKVEINLRLKKYL